MKKSEIRILVADDEPDALEFIKYNLKKEGYKVNLATTGVEAIKKAQKKQPDLIILDIMMPELDGIQTCKELRALPEFEETLIVFLTARSEEFTHVMGLDSGADDYLTKPIKPQLLVSKVKSLLRRYNKKEGDDLIKIVDLEINRDQFTLHKNGQLIELPKKEFNLLFLLSSKPGKVFTREKILKKIWGTDVIVNDRTIDVHIRKLREKLGEGYIKTIKGIGYKFDY